MAVDVTVKESDNHNNPDKAQRDVQKRSREGFYPIYIIKPLIRPNTDHLDSHFCEVRETAI